MCRDKISRKGKIMVMNDCNSEVLASIRKYQELISKTEEEIRDKKCIVDTLTLALIKSVKSLYIIFPPKVILEARNEIGLKKKSERKNLEYIKTMIESNVTNGRKVTITEINTQGYDNYKFSISFNLNGNKKRSFTLGVPNVKAINKSNLLFVDDGKYTLSYRISFLSAKRIITSYDLEKITGAFEKYLEALDNGTETEFVE